MKILITSAASSLAQNLATTLAPNHEIRLTEREPVQTHFPFFQNPLSHDETVEQLMVGIDAVVHVAESLVTDDEFAQLDYMTRCTYNLLTAASGSGIQHFIYLSTLDLFQPYQSQYRVDERWRPKPSPEPTVLGKHLGEYVCREFARERKTKVTVLRVNTQREVAAISISAEGSRLPDANQVELAQVIERSLTENADIWTIRHVVAKTYR
ncbi:MAG: NAD(P)-dependent oxidoreductase [Chloroflexota bacterium]